MSISNFFHKLYIFRMIPLFSQLNSKYSMCHETISFVLVVSRWSTYWNIRYLMSHLNIINQRMLKKIWRQLCQYNKQTPTECQCYLFDIIWMGIEHLKWLTYATIGVTYVQLVFVLNQCLISEISENVLLLLFMTRIDSEQFSASWPSFFFLFILWKDWFWSFRRIITPLFSPSICKTARPWHGHFRGKRDQRCIL